MQARIKETGELVRVLSDTDEHGIWTGEPEHAVYVEVEFPDGTSAIVQPEAIEPAA